MQQDLNKFIKTKFFAYKGQNSFKLFLKFFILKLLGTLKTALKVCFAAKFCVSCFPSQFRTERLRDWPKKIFRYADFVKPFDFKAWHFMSVLECLPEGIHLITKKWAPNLQNLCFLCFFTLFPDRKNTFNMSMAAVSVSVRNKRKKKAEQQKQSTNIIAKGTIYKPWGQQKNGDSNYGQTWSRNGHNCGTPIWSKMVLRDQNWFKWSNLVEKIVRKWSKWAKIGQNRSKIDSIQSKIERNPWKWLHMVYEGPQSCLNHS